MNRPVRAAIFVAATVLMIAAIIWWVFAHGSTSMALAEVEMSSGEPTDAQGTSRNTLPSDASPNARPASDPSPHPPIGTPVSETIASLLPKARAGDRDAACRIGIEYSICEVLDAHGEWMLSSLQNDEQYDADSRENPEVANRLAESQAKLIERRRACRALPEELRSNGTDWLAQAARAGHREATYRYLRGESVGYTGDLQVPRQHGLRMLGHPGLRTWIDDATRLARRQLEQGDVGALFLLSVANSEDQSMFDGLIRNDPVELAALSVIEGEIYGRRINPELDALSADDQPLALARAAELRPLFAGRPSDLSVLARSAVPGHALVVHSMPANTVAALCRE